MALAIEPMLVLGSPQTAVLADDWTVVTVDGSWAAHFEHTVAVTEDGPVVLTAEDGGAAGFAALRSGHTAAPPEQVGAIRMAVAEGAGDGI
jgi:methionyl aminopeptidase